MDQESYIALGSIQRIQGLKGQLVVRLHYDLDELSLEAIAIQMGHTLIPYRIERLTHHTDQAILKLKGVDTPNAAYALKGQPVWVKKDTLPEQVLQAASVAQLIGYSVEDTQGRDLGAIRDVYTVSKQHILAIDYKGRELLFPYQKDLIAQVDAMRKNITVCLPSGYLEASLQQ